MSDLKIQGEVEVSSEGAESAFQRVGDKADQMSRRVQQGANNAGRAVDGIGDTANNLGEQFTRAEGKIAASIKRATSQIENLGKTASQRIELKISEKGLDPAKFDPLLAKLRALEAAQENLGASGQRISRTLRGGIQNVGFQVQDMIVQMNGGVDATRALSQQLPQMLVSFGAVGAGLGVVAALLPNIMEAIGGGSDDTKKLSDAVGDLNSAVGEVGKTAKDFSMDNLYEEFNKANGAAREGIVEQLKFQQALIETQQKLAELSLRKTLANAGGGFVGLDQMKGGVAIETAADYYGIAVNNARELLPLLQEIRSGTADASSAMQKFGLVLASSTKDSAQQLLKDIKAVADGSKDAANAQARIEEAMQRMRNAGSSGSISTAAEAKAAKSAYDQLTQSIRDAIAVEQAASQQSDKLTGGQQMAAKFVADIVSGELKLTAAQKRSTAAALEELIALEKKNALYAESLKAAQDYAIGQGKAAASLADSVDKLREENAMLGLSARQVAEYTAAKLNAAAATEEANAQVYQSAAAFAQESGAAAAAIQLYQDLAESASKAAASLREKAALTLSNEMKKEAVDAAEASKKAWIDGWEATDRIARQAFADWADDGKDAAKRIGDALKTALLSAIYEATLKPVVFQVYGSVTNALGVGSANLGAGSTVGSAGNLINAGSSLYNLASGVGSAYSTGAYMLSGMGYEQAAMLAAQEVGLGSAATSATLSAAGSSTLASLSAAAPYVAAAIAVASLFSSDRGGPKSGGDAYYRYADGSRALLADSGSLGTSLYGPNDSNSQIAGTLGTSLSAMEQQIAALGGTLGNLDVALGFDIDPNGTANSRVKTRINGVNTSYDAGRSDAELQAAMTQAMNDLLAEVFKAANFDASTEQIAGVLIDDLKLSVSDAIAALSPIKTALAAVGIPAENFTATLVQAAGGLDAFTTELTAYYGNYTTEAEKTAAVTAQITERLAAVGLELPRSVQGFEDLMAAEIALGAAGEDSVAALLDVSSAFYNVSSAAEDAVQSMLDQLDALTPASWIAKANSALGGSLTALPTADEVRAYLQALQLDPVGNADKITAAQSLFADWQSLIGDPVANALDAVERSIGAEQEAIQNQTDATLAAIDQQITAQQAAYDAASEAVGNLSRIFDEIDGAVTGLRGSTAAGAAQQLAAGRSFIDQALATALSSGYLPDADALAKAIDAVRGDSAANYATRAEYEKAQLIQAGKLEALGAITGDQLDVNEQILRAAKDQLDALDDQRDAVEQAAKAQIDALDQQLAAAQQQVDALGGVDTSVKSVRDAVLDLKTAILGALGQKTTGNASGIDPTTPTYAAALASSTAAVAPYYDTMRENTVSLALSAAYAGNAASTKALAAEALQYGTAAQIAAGVAAQTGDATWTADKLIAWARDNDVPGYAAGGSFDGGLALVGERGPELVVTPPARIINNADTSGLFDVAALLAEIKRLAAITEKQQAALDRIAGNTSESADALNGRGKQPMRVETV